MTLFLASSCISGQPARVPISTPTAAAPTGAASVAPVPSSATAAWSRIADIPTPRSEVAAAVDQLETVYVIGGFGGPRVVERLDPSGKWERVADLPIGVDHAMAAGVSGIQVAGDEGIYLLGGYVDGVATARSFRFDRVSGRWSEIAGMPGPRAAGAAVAINTRIYVVGGADAGRLVAPTYEYDVVTRRWRTLAAIPTPRDHLAAVEMRGQVCAVGGRRLALTANLGTLECYLPQTDTWEALPSAPTPRGGVGAAFYDGRLYFIGGEQPSGTFKEVEIYDSRTRTWSRGPDLPTPRHGLGVVSTCCTTRGGGPKIHALAGGPTPGGSQTAVCEVLALP
jgi:non-specific serine/threonine protein kinase